MSGAEMPAPQGGGSNASEFVRKLFRMLEDKSHQDVARWGQNGDSFVVVEGEKFTRTILPKHFKHSNMSSFIRQLNKYDFHKVKPSGDGDGSSVLGNVLEFKHPNFRTDSKDDLDNIRRKAPATRKTQPTEDFTMNHHINLLSEQLGATQKQVQQLQDKYTDVFQTNKLLINEVYTLQKLLNAQKQAQYEMLNYLSLHYGDNQNHNGSMMNPQMTSNGRPSDANEAVPELRRARDLLSSVSTDPTQDRELERLNNVYYGSPADSNTNLVTPSSMTMLNDPMTDIHRYPVYPVGQTVGIDPFHSDHIHKIPYAMPNDNSNNSNIPDQQSQQQQQQQQQHPQSQQHQRHQSNMAPMQFGDRMDGNPIWGSRKPNVLLVEDDPTCAKIGEKFLTSMGCDVEISSNGVDAFQRVQAMRGQFDMIFMDIIMPRLDGVSATMYIRQTYPGIPIIAMTSNIRPEEVNGYFDHGMNGVLAKPFTKDGMYKSVRQHMGHLLKNPPNQPHESEIPGSGYYMGVNQFMSAPGAMKYETPTPPPTNAGQGWSPAQLPQPSPLTGGMDHGYNNVNGNNMYSMPTSHRPAYPSGMHSNESSTRVSDVDSPPEKRQRLNPTGNF